MKKIIIFSILFFVLFSFFVSSDSECPTLEEAHSIYHDEQTCGCEGIQTRIFLQDENNCFYPGEWSVCSKPTTETSCTDSIDNDCDGYVDCDDSDCEGTSVCEDDENGETSEPREDIDYVVDNFVPSGRDSSGIPVSDPVIRDCEDKDGDGFSDIKCGGTDCDDNNPLINPNAVEKCDGIDNNCDKVIDDNCDCLENQFRTCGSDVGICSLGMQKCINGKWDSCNSMKPRAEACNGLDDNCNGEVDENLARVCGYAQGSCSLGTQECVDGLWTECTGDIPGVEILNFKDDDCDGETDETFNFEQRTFAKYFESEAEEKFENVSLFKNYYSVIFDKEEVTVIPKKTFKKGVIVSSSYIEGFSTKNGVYYKEFDVLKKKFSFPAEEKPVLIIYADNFSNKISVWLYIVPVLIFIIFIFVFLRIIRRSKEQQDYESF